MFGLKKLLGNSITPLKVVASNNFMDSLNKISEVKETVVKERDDGRVEQSLILLNEATKIINRCVVMKDFSPPYLKSASEKLIKSIELNRNNPDAYIKLAKVFYTLGNNNLAVKYMKIAKGIKPDLEEVLSLTEIISTDGLKSAPQTNIVSKVALPQITKPTLPQKPTITRVPVRKI